MESIVLVAGVCCALVFRHGLLLRGRSNHGGPDRSYADFNCASTGAIRLYGKVAYTARVYEATMKYRYGSIQETCCCIREISPRLI